MKNFVAELSNEILNSFIHFALIVSILGMFLYGDRYVSATLSVISKAFALLGF